jgi:hypothetical protein
MKRKGITFADQSEQALQCSEVCSDAQIDFLDTKLSIGCAASNVASCRQVDASSNTVTCWGSRFKQLVH